jgi:DNA helicase-2/ATP-dependent DNA helicase PcrA
MLKPSRFLSELPNEHLNFVKIKSTNSPIQNYSKLNYRRDSPYQGGNKIIHEKFGIGIVTDCEGSGESKRIEVNFQQYGKKWLILAYAKIVKL